MNNSASHELEIINILIPKTTVIYVAKWDKFSPGPLSANRFQFMKTDINSSTVRDELFLLSGN